jgi:FlaA1/EpsC-like NDP-sugar epimerase
MNTQRKAILGIPRRYIIHVLKSAFIDVLIVIASYTVAFSARAVITPLEFLNGAKLIFLASIIIIGIFYIFGVYQRIWSQTSGHGMTILINATAVATLIVVLFDIIPEQRPLPLSIVILGNLLALSGFIAVRYRSRLISGMSWRWQAVWNQKFPKGSIRVLIVGAGQSGQEVAVRLKHRTPQNNYTVVGFIDDDIEKRNMYVEGCRVLGNRAEIQRIVEDYLVDLIVVAIHNISGPDFRHILTQCENTQARIKVVPDVSALMDAKQNVDFLRDVQAEDLLGRGVISHHEEVDLSPIKGKVILVTGAAGSIGSELSRQLPTYNPSKLILLDCNESGLHDLTIELSAKFPDTQLIQFLADITVCEAVHEVFTQYHPQIVFHAAAYKHVPILQSYPSEAVRVNIGGTRLVAELAQAHGVERFVLISTDKAVNPLSVMGASKRVCELLMKALSQQVNNRTLFTSVRFGNVLGSRGSVVTTFNQQLTGK